MVFRGRSFLPIEWLYPWYTITASFAFGIAINYYPRVANEVIEEYSAIFPEVQDIDFREDARSKEYSICMKIGNTWVEQRDISSGMLKTLYLLILTKTTMPEKCLLIDEFENSLGINCIDQITENITSERNDIQFIITSHHPYIINNIDINDCMVVVREGATVTAKPAIKLGITKSHQDSFFKLINTPEFRGEKR